MEGNRLAAVQARLREEGLEAWLLLSFGPRNSIALEVLGLEGVHLTRRFAYLIPREGTPGLLCHAIEESLFPPLPGERHTYRGFGEFRAGLEALLGGRRRIALEYLPGGGIPYLSQVDGGTLDLLRGIGVEAVSSWPLLLPFQAWGEEELRAHRRAAEGLKRALERGLDRLRAGGATEEEVQRVLAEALLAQGLLFDHPPMVAFGPNAANPHHTPGGKVLERGEVALLDLWAKEPGGVYADITWMAGLEVGEAVHRAFRAVARARDEAIRFIQEAYRVGRYPQGAEADRVARWVLEEAGYGESLRHRTGHNLGREVHGHGPHLDSLEAPEFRPLVPGLAFTVEPGVYLEGQFGVRSEVNVYLHPSGPEVTTPIQEAITPL